LLECFPEMNEEEASPWLDLLERPVQRMEAERLGALIATRQWKELASKAFQIRGWQSDLDPLLQRCRDLLTFWERLRLGDIATPSKGEILRELARLGADRYPGGPESVWSRAGGSPSHLDHRGNGHEQWQRAVEYADRGGLPYGALALLKIMLEDFPHNWELGELWRIFSARGGR
jgi:hypothetical protein